MATPEQLIDGATRHQVYLERLKTGEVNKLTEFLLEIDKTIRKRLAGKDLTAYRRGRLEKLLATIDDDLKRIYQGYGRELRKDLREIAIYEAGFESRALTSVVTNFEVTVPAANVITAAVFAKPLTMRGANGGLMLRTLIDDFTATERKRVTAAIRQGFTEGQTTNQILQAVRGTRANRFKDGILNISNRHAATLVRTSVQHVANTAREEVYKENSIVTGVRWVSALDSRTSSICRSLDGRVFEKDKGPRPPAHPNCLLGDTNVLSRSRVTNAYKRWYEGRLIEITTKSGRNISITPNHPVLTRSGWKAAGEINCFDELVTIPSPAILEGNKEDCVESSFSDLFAAANVAANPLWITDRPSASEDFHGDGSNGDVRIVNINRLAWDRIRELLGQNRENNRLVFGRRVNSTFERLCSFGFLFKGNCSAFGGLIRGANKFGDFIRRRASHSRKLLFASVSWFNTLLSKVDRDRARGHAKLFGDTRNTDTIIKHRNNLAGVNVEQGAFMFRMDFDTAGLCSLVNPADINANFDGSILGCDSARDKVKRFLGKSLNSVSSLFRKFHFIESTKETGFCNASDGRALLDGGAGAVEFDSVTKCDIINFSGHVYNLENKENWYLSNGIITHNCRSSTVPDLDDRFAFLDEDAQRSSQEGPVDADLSYYDWLKRQPAAFQDDVLGPTRGKLLRGKGMTAERFGKLNLDKRFNPLTLDEMRIKEPAAFESAGL